MVKKQRTTNSSKLSVDGKKTESNSISNTEPNEANKVLDFSERQKVKMSQDTMNSGMFGDLDTDTISTALENGTYLFELTDIKTFYKADADEPDNKEKGRNSLIFNWMVADTDNEQFGEEFQQWFTIFPNLTNYKDLPNTEKLKIKKAVNWLKNQLETLGLSQDQFNNFTPASLKEDIVGLRAYIEVVVQENPNTKQKFTKPKKIILEANVDTATNGTDGFSF